MDTKPRTPQTNDMVERFNKRISSAVLKVGDHVGIALDVNLAYLDHQYHDDDSVIRPDTDAAFEENEAKIACDVKRETLQLIRYRTDDPTVVYWASTRSPAAAMPCIAALPIASCSRWAISSTAALRWPAMAMAMNIDQAPKPGLTGFLLRNFASTNSHFTAV